MKDIFGGVPYFCAYVCVFWAVGVFFFEFVVDRFKDVVNGL